MDGRDALTLQRGPGRILHRGTCHARIAESTLRPVTTAQARTALRTGVRPCGR
ncbi:DUF6233 domain-containing protein [Streptomyces sp. NPDC004031]